MRSEFRAYPGREETALLVRSMYSDAVNHEPGVNLFNTGSPLPGRPSLGAWASYGLGTENENLPAYVVLVSGFGGQNLSSRYWGHGFLPSQHQGVQFRSAREPVLFMNNPAGIDGTTRRRQLDALSALNHERLFQSDDPATVARIEAYELAFSMQSQLPELADIAREPQHMLDLYGADPNATDGGGTPFANNCLLARRLSESGVRFVQLYHRDWDHHALLPTELERLCRATDQGAAALIKDLDQRRLLDETLVIWGGEFGRTPFSQGQVTPKMFGRDHHGHCFTMWLAGGGIKPGMVYGSSDDFGYHVATDGVHIHDLQATILHLMGIDHEQLTFRHQGRDFRLTDVGGRVVEGLVG